MALKPLQFTIGRMLHAMLWSAVAAALFAVTAHLGAAPVRFPNLRAIPAVGALAASCVAIGVLFGGRTLGRGRTRLLAITIACWQAAAFVMEMVYAFGVGRLVLLRPAEVNEWQERKS